MLGWLKSPSRTRACEHDASCSRSKKASLDSKALSGVRRLSLILIGSPHPYTCGYKYVLTWEKVNCNNYKMSSPGVEYRLQKISNTPAMSRDICNYIRLLRAPSNLTLNVSRDGASTTSLGNLFHCFTTLIDKQPQLSQPFLIGEVFHPSDNFCGPPLDLLQQIHALLDIHSWLLSEGVLILEYSGPRILCIPDSKTLRVSLKYPLVLSARGSRHLGSSSLTVSPTPPCLLNHVLKCHIYMFFNSSRDGDFTTSLDTLFQCLTTLSVKKFFLISNLNLPWCNLRPPPLVLSLVTWEKRLTPTSLQPPFRMIRSPLSLFFSRLNNPSSLSRSS
ncbi:hypothetical protein QYF61_016048 [Mycteria americana]|uniref:Uncharacterized protein n=1 Tax=Mycteria americana TaxID=33587 RepID=A0AAN7SIC4_MYCAM|nr:hypothetical protein QYF61_016048 [Mycteria americana]